MSENNSEEIPQPSDDDQNHSNGLLKNKRRTRKDYEGRDYYCLCGKSYLSYPALYTHIKTKHEGKVSSYLVKTPHSKENRIITHKNNNGQDPNNKQMYTKENLEQLKMLLQKHYPERYRASPTSEILGKFTTSQKEFWEPLLLYWVHENCKQKPDHNSENLSREESLDRNKAKFQRMFPAGHYSADYVFAKFLDEMNKRVNLQCIVFLSRFLIMIRRAVSMKNQNPKYCEENTAALIPLIFNDLIFEKAMSPDCYGKNPWIDKDDDKQKISTQKILEDDKVICQILHYFANWMYNNKYTNYTVKYKQQ